MISKYSILLKKEKGFERINDVIIRSFESEGWSAKRNENKDFVVMVSNKTQHYFKNDKEAASYVLRLVGKESSKRLNVVRFVPPPNDAELKQK